MLTIAKFGGSSLSDAAQFRKVQAIIATDPARRGVVVSAAGRRYPDDNKITDLLYLCHAHLQYGVPCDSVFRIIAHRYQVIRDELGLFVDIGAELSAIRDKMDHGISRDELASRGEYLSGLLVASLLGFPFLDSARWLFFSFDGTPDVPRSYNALKTLSAGKPFVTTGFYGVLPDGRIHTFPRGGSDITGALAAAAVGAELYENWTDVPGILMADPRIINDPKPIPFITYDELRELSKIGMQVLHEGAVQPVREKGIPLNIRNTNDPAHPGTMIRERRPDAPERAVCALSGRRGQAILSLYRDGLARELPVLYNLLHELRLSPDTFSFCVERVTFCLPQTDFEARRHELIPKLQTALSPERLQVLEQLSMICVIGPTLSETAERTGHLITALGAHNIPLISCLQPGGGNSLILCVPDQDYEAAIQTLYDACQ